MASLNFPQLHERPGCFYLLIWLFVSPRLVFYEVSLPYACQRSGGRTRVEWERGHRALLWGPNHDIHPTRAPRWLWILLVRSLTLGRNTTRRRQHWRAVSLQNRKRTENGKKRINIWGWRTWKVTKVSTSCQYLDVLERDHFEGLTRGGLMLEDV